MKNNYRHIFRILLLITTLYLTACNNNSIPTEMMEFKNNYENSDDYLSHLANIADSCSKNYAKNPVFLEKKSQIFFQKGRNEHKNADYLNATKSLVESYKAQKNLISLKKEADNDDHHYLGQILENIGDIYSDINSLKPASYFYDQALTQFENASRQHEVIDILLKIGDLYQQNHISNIALLNYEIAEEKKNLTEDQFNIIQIKKGIALYDIFDKNAADSLYGRISTKSPQTIEYQYFTACHFFNDNNFYAALPYLLKCFNEGNAKMKVEAAEMLASVYFSLNDHDKELYYAQYQAKKEELELFKITHKRENIESDHRLIQFRDSQGKHKMSLSEDSIFYIESQDNYVQIFYDLEGKLSSYLLRCSTQKIEEDLVDTSIVRCRRSFLVNTAKIVRYGKERGHFTITLDQPSGKTITVTPAYYRTILTQLDKRSL